jgi:perosamine synthetase
LKETMAERMIPYGRQWIDNDDTEAVLEVLRSDWLTTGPKVEGFETDFARFVGARAAVAVSSGTAALHAAMYAIGIAPGDEVIVPAMTFVASANCVVFQGGTPVFADVSPHTLLIDSARVEARITERTKAIIAVDYAGQPCSYDALRILAKSHKLSLVSDASHSTGAVYKGRPVGSLADLTTFSFHPVKNMTTGEGGMVTTDDPALERRLRSFRNHGLTKDSHERERAGSWHYEMDDLGYNYRLTDFQCALGQTQLGKLPGWIQRRREIAGRYDTAFGAMNALTPLALEPDVQHAYHLYVVQLDLKRLKKTRDEMYSALRSQGIGVNVHYMPVHLHPFYGRRFGTHKGMCPVAERAYERIISLPMFPRMTDNDVNIVIATVQEVVKPHDL